MNADELAELVATYVDALASPPIVFNATVPATAASVEAETADWKVFVLPYGESEEALDRGDMCREELTCSVVINGPVNGVTTKQNGLELSKFLRTSLRETEFSGFRWESNEVATVYDFDALKTKSQFLSLFRATYFQFA